MTTKQTVLILAGHMQSHALPAIQLGLTSAFDLYIGRQFYFEASDLFIPNATMNAAIVKARALGENIQIEALRSFLNINMPAWRGFKHIVYYPVTLYFNDWKSFDFLLTKLILNELDSCVFFGDIQVFSLKVATLLNARSDLYLSDITYSNRVTSDLCHANISAPTGIFDIARTQTASRIFNTFRSNLPNLIKTTSLKDKGLSEYNFFKNIPRAISSYYPHVGTAEETTETFSYEIEFLTMFDLSRFVIHNSLSLANYRDLLTELSRYLARTPTLKTDCSKVQESLVKLFVSKLLKRTQEFKQLSYYPEIEHLSYSIYRGGYSQLVNDLDAELNKAISRINNDKLYFSHGDLCFSNILWDKLSCRLKLIDPRGDFDGIGSYLPIYYDLAKLSHSFLGSYDWIMNGLTEVSFGKDLKMDLRLKTNSSVITESQVLFKNWIADSGWDQTMVRLGEASLFLSMLPLHSDQPEIIVRQICAGANALIAAKGS